LLLISHDLALVSAMADRVVVMYAGQAVETGRPPEIFQAPAHPYTRALLQALPDAARGQRRLIALPGVVPGVEDRPDGCLLAPRCPHAQERCQQIRPVLRVIDGHRQVACHFDLATSSLGITSP
jgi:dipeptide transport system ATP-binding protein